MLKKSSVWLIVLAIFLWILPLSTAAESTADGLEYEVTGDGVTVTKYTGSAAQVTVPASIDGKPVTAIGDQAFFMCADLTSVTLPEGLKRIGLNAFLSSGLTSVVVPDSVTDMGEGVFDGCRALTSAVLPAGLKEIPARTFQMCEALTSFTIPSGVTSIGFAAFEGCRALPNIQIPNGVERVDTWAFSGCELITSVYLPDSVRYLGEWVFSGSVALASVRIPDGVETILGSILSSTAYYNNESNWNGCALYAGRHLVDVKYDAAGAYTILPGTLTVCDYAFNQRQELTSLSVPDSVRYIGPEAFTECSKLTDIYFAGSEAQWNAAFAGNTEATVHFNAEPRYTGDADNDGKVTSTDARLTLQAAVGKIGLDGLNAKTMDVDGDDTVTSTDARLILQYAVGKIDSLGDAAYEQTYRVLLSSDVHSGHVYYGFDPEQRLQEYVDFINAEHKKQAFDLMIFMGDYSLDYWINGGTVLHQGRSDTRTFIEKWVPQLPDVPKFFLAGNHEQYSEEEWQTITGNSRSGCVKLGDNTFVLLDAFAGDLDPKKDADGTYVKLDYAAVQAAVEENPEGNVWVMAHFIDHGGESAEFKQVIANNDAVRGMFMGHRHSRDLIQAGAAYGNKILAQVGNFADTRNEGCIWGFRDLIITGKSAVSRYLTAPIKQGQVNNEYSISRQVKYNEDGTFTLMPDPQENVFEKMGRTGMNMQSGNYSETFSPQDLSGYNTLSFDLTFTTDVDFDNLVCTKSQFELTSSGGPDLNEWNWNMLEVLRRIGGTHKTGEKLTVTLNMDELKPETKSGDQTLDLKGVTFLRWYCKELKSPLAFDIGSFRFE